MSPNFIHWCERLRVLANKSLPDFPDVNTCLPADRRAWADSFADELGHRRAIDAAVAARVTGVEPAPMPSNPSADLRLWWSLWDAASLPAIERSGPVTAFRADQSIELWTETELGALHAAWNFALDHRDSALVERCLDACEWHTDRLQPDNATNHAWALHGFLICAHMRDDAAAELHAQSLLHASMISTGRPDRLSACLMLDAVRGLEEFEKMT